MVSDEVAGTPAGRFLDRLRLVLGRVEAVDLAILAEKSAPCRTDALLELGADLSDACVGFAAGRMNETVVREAAVAVAVEAFKIWVATREGCDVR